MTANPVVNPNNLASGYFSRESAKILFLIALATPLLRKAGATISPLLATYSDVDLEKVNAAARAVGAGEVKKLTDNRSTEADWVQKISPVKGFKGYPR